MGYKKRQMKALQALNLDLFDHGEMVLPAPATLYTKIKAAAHADTLASVESLPLEGPSLPDEKELARRFEVFNWMYFKGKLPKVRIEYSNRMTSAGSYTPSGKVIKIGRKYHEIFPEDINDTLKHEMIHILHFRHDRAFKREAERIGASLRARAHPALQRPPRFVYYCEHCGMRYPRQKRLRMASCGQCSKGGRYDERFKLKLMKTAAKREG